MKLQARREKLLDAAWRLIQRDGVTATSTRAICREAGMRQSHFHYCFDSRASLLQQILDNEFSDHLQRVISTYPTDLSGGERVQQMLQNWWADIVAHTQVHYAIFDVTLQSRYQPDLAGVGTHQHHVLQQAIRADLQAISADGRWRWDGDIDELTAVVQVFLGGLCLRHFNDPQDPAIPALIARFSGYLATQLHPAASNTAPQGESSS